MINERKISDLYNRIRKIQAGATGDLDAHIAETTTAHGLGASAFHANSYFALALSGTQYRLMRYATASTDGDSPVYTNLANTKVGIGKTPTTLELEVDGGIDCETIKITTGATDGYFLKSDADGAGSWAAVAASQVYKGTWNATTNTPTLADGTGTSGWYYRCVVAGTVNFGAGNITFAVGDDVYYNGSVWQLIPAAGFTLQTATDTVLGGIKVGDTLQINSAVLDVADDLYALDGHTHAQLHDAATVTDSASVNFTLSGQDITAVAIFGTASGTVCQGNDSRLSDARVASDVSAWAKAATKPTYTYTEVGADASGAAATVQNNLTTHAGLTTAAHGLGASAFHADSYFALAGHTHAQLHDAVTLATNSGLGLSGQELSMGTPSTCNGSTTNAVSTSTHTHAISGFEISGTTATHAALTTTAHGLGASAFHADSYFSLSGHTHAQLHDAVTLAINSGLSLSSQQIAMGTPTTCTAGTSNSVTSSTHAHQVTGFDPSGTTATHAALTTTAHGLGASAFHADSYFALSSAISGTQHYISKFNAAGTGVVNSQIYDNGTSVGINTVTATEKFEVKDGGISLNSSDVGYTRGIQFKYQDTTYSGLYQDFTGGDFVFLHSQANKCLSFQTFGSVEKLRIYGSGNYAAHCKGNLLFEDFASVGRMYSGTDAVFGGNVYSDPTTRTLKFINTGYYGNWIRMYYNQGIYFGTSTIAGTAGATICDPAGTTNEKMVLTNAGKLGIGILSGLVATLDINVGAFGNNVHFKTSESTYGSGVYIQTNYDGGFDPEINCSWGINGSANLLINYAGYNGGKTVARSTLVYDGKGALLGFFDGVSGRVGIGSHFPSTESLLYILDVVNNAVSGNTILAGFRNMISAPDTSVSILLGKEDTSGNSAKISFKWLGNNYSANKISIAFSQSESAPIFSLYNNLTATFGTVTPYDATTILSLQTDFYVKTWEGSGIRMYGTLSGGITNNYVKAIAIGGGTPAFFSLSIGDNIAIRLSESGDVKCGYKFSCNGNSPVGKSATATTLAQVITCLQDFGFMT